MSLKTAWRILIQASRRLRRAGHVVPVQGRGEIDRFLALEAPSDWDPSAFKRLLKGLVDSNSDHVQDQYAEQINNRIARNLQPTQVDEVYLYVAGGPPWLSRAQIDEWLGTREGCLKCTPREAAALVHHLDGLPIGGSPLSVTSDNARPLPAIRREDRARQRARGSSLWLPNYDEIGRLSLTPRSLADAHAARLLEFADVVFDPFCGLGGDAIAAAKAGARVFAAELDEGRLAHARANAEALAVRDRIKFWNDSGPECLNIWAGKEPRHALFLDPPWGGRDWERKGMNWDLLCGGFPSLTSAMQSAAATLIKLPRTFDTSTLPMVGGKWTLSLGLGDRADHPADRIRFLVGLHEGADVFTA